MRRYLALLVLLGAMSAGASPAGPSGAAKPQEQPHESSYAQKVRAVIIQHVVLVEPIQGNPAAQVKVTTRPDGEIVDAELIASSGHPGWDKAVRIAVLKTGRMPLDTDGTVPSVLYITFRPNP